MVIVLRPVYFNAAVLDCSSPGLLPFIKICVQCYIFVGIIQTCLNFLTDPELILRTFLCATTIGTVSLAEQIITVIGGIIEKELDAREKAQQKRIKKYTDKYAKKEVAEA